MFLSDFFPGHQGDVAKVEILPNQGVSLSHCLRDDLSLLDLSLHFISLPYFLYFFKHRTESL